MDSDVHIEFDFWQGRYIAVNQESVKILPNLYQEHLFLEITFFLANNQSYK